MAGKLTILETIYDETAAPPAAGLFFKRHRSKRSTLVLTHMVELINRVDNVFETDYSSQDWCSAMLVSDAHCSSSVWTTFDFIKDICTNTLYVSRTHCRIHPYLATYVPR